MNSCQRYGAARQQCAVAGDFSNCMKIRMGEEYQFVSEYCTDDGKVRGVTDMPSAVECFIGSIGWLDRFLSSVPPLIAQRVKVDVQNRGQVKPHPQGANDRSAERKLPRTYLIFGDIEGESTVLRVECTKCPARAATASASS